MDDVESPSHASNSSRFAYLNLTLNAAVDTPLAPVFQISSLYACLILAIRSGRSRNVCSTIIDADVTIGHEFDGLNHTKLLTPTWVLRCD